MGLDNGIILKIKSEKAREFYKNFCEETGLRWWGEYDSNTENENEIKIEICYWRKFWGFRNECFYINLLNDEDYYYYNTVEQIQAVYSALEEYTEKDYWYDNENNSIWDYYEYLHIIYKSLGNLKIVENLIQEFLRNGFKLRSNEDNYDEDVDIEVYMYDSY